MIKLLGKKVSDKIAAGEVIESPVSVVKELVENSIDAGADDIVVEIKNGGSKYIRVTDNGGGIPGDETEMAFLRHATSKIEKVEDLDSLESLGFRGEALASIAAVSRTELITKTKDSKVGSKVVLEGGRVVEHSSVGCPEGTTITVTDLFYNTPARRKFLKSQASESNKIIELMTNIAMAYPDIKVRMINNETILFATRGTGSRLDAITTVTGKHDGRNLMAVSGSGEGLEIEGYVTGPGESRPNRKGQIFFVNGRIVDSKVIERGIRNAYRERLFEGRYPSAYLFIEVDPETLDVNIHPNKREIRFDNNDIIAEFVEKSVKMALETESAVPDIKPGESVKTDLKTGSDDRSANNIRSNISTDNILQNQEVSEQVNITNILSSIRDKNQTQEYSSSSMESETQGENAADSPLVKEESAGYNQGPDLTELRAVGVIFSTYVLLEGDDYIYMLDQHAAHERIFYEDIKRRVSEGKNPGQEIMVPITFDCLREDDFTKPLSDFGFVIEEFGPGTYAARTIPEFFDLSSAENFIYDYLDMLDSDPDYSAPELKDRIATMACKRAVKAGDSLKDEEIKQLLKDLSSCENPYSCPHGRPTFIKMTKYDIEKRFKRV